MPAVMGRPTKLTDEVWEQANDYYVKCLNNREVPHAAGLAVTLGVSKKTLYNWADDNEDFLHMLDNINTLQESTLLQGSLENKLNATISKLMLAKHGYVEKTETDITSNGETVGQADPLIAAEFAAFLKQSTEQ